MVTNVNEIKVICENMTNDKLVENYGRYATRVHAMYASGKYLKNEETFNGYKNIRDALKEELLKRLGETEE